MLNEKKIKKEIGYQMAPCGVSYIACTTWRELRSCNFCNSNPKNHTESPYNKIDSSSLGYIIDVLNFL